MKTISICHSPALGHLYDFSNKLVVVADIYRATSCIVTGIHNNLKEIVPVAEVNEVEAYRERGYLVAGERNGIQVEGFDMGNSPFSFAAPDVSGRSVVMTTTNGTRTIYMAKQAEVLLIGAFLNLDAVTTLAASFDMEIIVVCAGWKGRYSLEDSLFAGAFATKLLEKGFETHDDATVAAVTLFQAVEDRLEAFVSHSNHAERLRSFTDERDINFCLERNKFDTVPVLRGKTLVKYK